MQIIIFIIGLAIFISFIKKHILISLIALCLIVLMLLGMYLIIRKVSKAFPWYSSCNHYDPQQRYRIYRALNDNLQVHSVDKIKKSGEIIGTSGEIYKVSLNSCSCPDFKHRLLPCKHMYKLGIALDCYKEKELKSLAQKPKNGAIKPKNTAIISKSLTVTDFKPDKPFKIEKLAETVNYKEYKVKGKYAETNYPRTITISCHKDDTIEHVMEKEGFLPPYEVEQLPYEPPAEYQLESAKDFKLKLPPNLNRNDLSCILSRIYNEENAASKSLIKFADGRKFKFSYYIGSSSLYNLIFVSLQPLDKAAYFCFAVNQFLTKNTDPNLDEAPNKITFYEFAKLYVNDEKFMKSLNANYNGETFHELFENASGKFIGGNKSTYAYKTAADFLKTHFGIINKNSVK